MWKVIVSYKISWRLGAPGRIQLKLQGGGRAINLTIQSSEEFLIISNILKGNTPRYHTAEKKFESLG